MHPRPDDAGELDLFELARDLTAKAAAPAGAGALQRHPPAPRAEPVRGLLRRGRSVTRYTGGYRRLPDQGQPAAQRGRADWSAAVGDCIGLEAGSKPELMAVLASAPVVARSSATVTRIASTSVWR